MTLVYGTNNLIGLAVPIVSYVCEREHHCLREKLCGPGVIVCKTYFTITDTIYKGTIADNPGSHCSLYSNICYIITFIFKKIMLNVQYLTC